jgi:ABC-type polysaccharide transport system permease subunit
MPLPSKLRRIPTANPLIMCLSVLLLGSVLAIGFRTDFRSPSPIVSGAVSLFVVAINAWSRKSRAKALRDGPPK